MWRRLDSFVAIVRLFLWRLRHKRVAWAPQGSGSVNGVTRRFTECLRDTQRDREQCVGHVSVRVGLIAPRPVGQFLCGRLSRSADVRSDYSRCEEKHGQAVRQCGWNEAETGADQTGQASFPEGEGQHAYAYVGDVVGQEDVTESEEDTR